MIETSDRQVRAELSIVPMTPEAAAQLNRLCAQLASAKQRSAAWLKHGPTGILSTAAFLARWLQFEAVEAEIADEIRRLTCPPVELRLKSHASRAPDIAA